MKRSTQLLLGSAVVVCGCALVTWMFALSRLNFDFTAMKLNILLLTVYALCAYYVNFTLCTKGLSLGVYVALQLLFAALAAVIYPRLTTLLPAETRPVVIGAILYACLSVATAYLAAGEVKSGMVALCFDGAAVMLVTTLLLHHFLPLPLLGSVVSMCVLVLVLSIVALMAARVDREDHVDAVRGDPAAGRVLLAAALLMLLAVAALAVLLAGDGMHQLAQMALSVLKTLVSWGKQLLSFVGSIVVAILEWLSEFGGGEIVDPGLPIANPDAPGTTTERADVRLPPYVGYLLAGLAIVLVLLLLFRMRGERVQSVGTLRRSGSRRRVRRESGWSAAFAALLRRMLQKVRYYVNCVRRRHSAPALLLWCERHAPAAHRRRTGESGSAFLRRLAQTQDSAQQDPLFALADCLERHFYGGGSAAVSRKLYRQIRRCKF